MINPKFMYCICLKKFNYPRFLCLKSLFHIYIFDFIFSGFEITFWISSEVAQFMAFNVKYSHFSMFILQSFIIGLLRKDKSVRNGVRKSSQTITELLSSPVSNCISIIHIQKQTPKQAMTVTGFKQPRRTPQFVESVHIHAQHANVPRQCASRCGVWVLWLHRVQLAEQQRCWTCHSVCISETTGSRV